MKSRIKTSSKKATNADKNIKLVLEVVRQVEAFGWTDLAVEEALTVLRTSKATFKKQFPNGVDDLVAAFGDWVDDEMLAAIKQSRGFVRMRVREKVAFGVRARLEAIAPYKESFRRLLLWYVRPNHALSGMQRLAKSVDLIWREAGDTSTDYNFYTKRVLLSGVMKATLLYWLNDGSTGSKATWEFLDRRINDVVRAGKSFSLLGEIKMPEIIDTVLARFRAA
jgi:ubiquinone biosynthesis protein COQ9